MSQKPRNNSKEPAHVLVYSTDGPIAKLCAGCQRSLEQCKCPKSLTVGDYKPAVRIERKGRGGKTVTILFKLPAHETYLKELCAYLKRSLGTGGTHYLESGEGSIEIQGERTQQVLALVEKFKLKK